MFIVDSQVHIWGPDVPERPWFKSEAVPHREDAFTAEDMLKEMEDAGVARAIVIPPSWEGERADVALAAVERYPERFAVMARGPIDDPNGREAVRTLRRTKGVLGMRLTLRTARELRLLTDPSEDWVWQTAEEAGIPVMTYPMGRIGEFEDVAMRHPGLKLIIDHMGFRRAKDREALVDVPQVTKLARYPNIAVKASCLPFYSSQPYPYRNLHDPVRRICDGFGPERVFWGSDFTRLPGNSTYRQARDLFLHELPWLSQADKELIMGRAICAWLDWPAP